MEEFYRKCTKMRWSAFYLGFNNFSQMKCSDKCMVSTDCLYLVMCVVLLLLSSSIALPLENSGVDRASWAH